MSPHTLVLHRPEPLASPSAWWCIWQPKDKCQEMSPDVSCCSARPQFGFTVQLDSTWMSVHTWEDPGGGGRKGHTHVFPSLVHTKGVCLLGAWHLGDISPQRGHPDCPPRLAPARGSDRLRVPPEADQSLRLLQGGGFIASVLVPPAGQRKTWAIPTQLSTLSSLDRFPFPCAAGCS